MIKFKILISFGIKMFQYFRGENVSIASYYIQPVHFFYNSLNIESISFFSHQKSHHLLGYHATGINSSRIIFLSYLHFSNLICQAENLIRIIVSGSSSSKLLSRLTFLRSILRIHHYKKIQHYRNLH